MAEDAGGQPFQARREWSPKAISKERHARANRNRLTPMVPGAFEGEGRLCTPCASMSFGACASSSGSACVKQAACKTVNSDRDFIMYRRGIGKAAFIKMLTEWYPGRDLSI